MRIIADLKAGRLILPEAVYPVSNRIRTLRDRTRKAYEIIRSIPDNLPYDPQPFPKGLWRITDVEWNQGKGFDYPTYGPVKIRTDAWQQVNIWELDRDGDYLRETDQRVKDTCYWLHYSSFTTTLGCIRLASPEDAVAIADSIVAVLWDEPVELEVA
jgi:hypothetical protein